MIEYSFALHDAYGNRIETFVDPISFEYTRADMKVGGLTLILPYRYADAVRPILPPASRPRSFERHYQIRIFRRVDRGTLYLEPGCVWIITKPARVLMRNGERVIKIQASSWEWVLTTRIIPYHTDHDKSRHGVEAMDLPKRWFRDQFTPQTYNEPGRELQTAGYLALAPTTGVGPYLNQEASYGQLLMTITESVELARQQALWMTFDFYSADGNGAFPWTFQTYQNQLGTNRVAGVHPRPVILSALSGEITESEFGRNYGDEWTVVYGLGEGSGEDRVTTSVTDAARVAGSPWGRIERVYANREAESIDEITDGADAYLRRGNPLYDLVLTVEDTKWAKYGRDYFYGDRVSIEIDDDRPEFRIIGVQMSMNDGKEVKRLAFENVMEV